MILYMKYIHMLEKNFRIFRTPIPPSVGALTTGVILRGTLSLSHIFLGLFAPQHKQAHSNTHPKSI